MPSGGTILTVLISEGVAFVSALVYFGFKAGRLIEKIESHEKSIRRLDAKVFYEEVRDE